MQDIAKYCDTFCDCYNTMCALFTLLTFCRDWHYNDVIMSAKASQITSLSIVCPNAHSGADQRKNHSRADQRKHQSSASLAFVRGIHRWPVNSPHNGPVTRKMFPFDDVIMRWSDGIFLNARYREIFRHFLWSWWHHVCAVYITDILQKMRNTLNSPQRLSNGASMVSLWSA